MECRPSNCRCIPHASRSRMEHAPIGNIQLTRLTPAAIPGCSTYKLGHYQRRYNDRGNDFLSHAIDTGRIIMQRTLPITSEDNAGTIHDKLMFLGADMVTDTVDEILEGNISCIEQDSIEPKEPLRQAPKIFKEDCRIDWNRPARYIHDFVRGLSPYPAAWCEWKDDTNIYSPIKIFQTEISEEMTNNLPAGTIRTDGKTYIEIKCGQDALRILSLQLPGKKRLTVEELLRGFPLNNSFISR